MKFLLPIIIVGALLASQIASAQVSSSPLNLCANRALERRALRLIRVHRMATCQPKTAMSSSSVSSSASSQPTSRTSPTKPSQLSLDPLSDTDIHSQFLLLGEVSPILGAASIFLEEEPLSVTSISINITAEVSTVQSFLVYDDQRHLLGNANLDPSMSTNRSYKAYISNDAFVIDKREQRNFYVRARLNARDAGGQSNQVVQIANIVVKGTGVWSSQSYTKVSTQTSSYPVFVTSRSTIVSVKNAGQASASLVTGSNREIGRFRFIGRRTDSSAHIDLTDLTFELQQTGGAALTNVFLVTPSVTERLPCTVNSSQITCSSIPDAYGSLTDEPRTIILYGDVTAIGPQHASLRLSLSPAGTSDTAGAISWSDGSTTFTWVALDGTAVDGTLYQY